MKLDTNSLAQEKYKVQWYCRTWDIPKGRVVRWYLRSIRI